MGKFRAWLQGGTADHSGLESVEWDAELIYAYQQRRQSLAASVASIYRARALTVDILASMPVRTSDGTEARSPNPRQTRKEWLTEAIRSMTDSGEAYLRRDGDNARVLKPGSMEVTWSADGTTRVYHYQTTARSRTRLFPFQLTVVPLDRGVEDLRGFGPMQSPRIQGLIAEQQYSQQYFEAGGPSGTLAVPWKLTKEQATALKEQWTTQQVDRAPAVLSGGITWSKEGATPAEADWVKTHMAGTGDAALLFGVPGTILGYNTPGASLTYESLADVHEQWWREVLYPSYASALEDAMAPILGETVRFDPEDFFLATLQSRTFSAKTLVDAGWAPEDAADVTGLPPMRHLGVLPTTVQKEDA